MMIFENCFWHYFEGCRIDKENFEKWLYNISLAINHQKVLNNISPNVILSLLDRTEIISVPSVNFLLEAKYLLNNFGKVREKWITIPHYDFDNSELSSADTLSRDSINSADIHVILYDSRTHPNLNYDSDFCLKSKPDSDTTLINSNKDASNFIFKIEGITDSQMRHVNTLDKFNQKFEYIKSVGGSWHFQQVAGVTLRDNLTLLDMGLPRIIAACMEKYYTGQGYNLAEITRKVSCDDPLHINNSEHQPMYEYKIKQFLLAFALGMTVSSPWYGTFNANGGYIVVKEDGEVICYHFFDHNGLEDYLFNNTRFDTPSTRRHEFGEVYKELDSYFIKLNLLVRFNK